MGQKTEMKTPGVVQFNMHLPTRIIKKRDVYISSCPILDVVSQGETEEEAKNNLVEAVTAFAISCFERGTLEKVLEQCGFKPVHGGAFVYPKNYKSTDYIDVPIPILASYENRCHA